MSVLILQGHGVGPVSTPGDGWIKIPFTVNGVTSNLYLDATNGVAGTQYFKTAPIGEDVQQSYNIALAFNRDYSNVGGSGNMNAEGGAGYISITAINGTFGTFEQSGGYATLVTVDNEEPADPVRLIINGAISGDCDDITYPISATGGTGTFTLKNGSALLVSGWDGTQRSESFQRGTVNNLSVTDGNDTDSTTLNIPRKLKAGEFEERITQYVGYSDVEIESVNPVAGTTPVQYAITDLGETTGSGYSVSNSFPGILPGQYLLWIKDKWGCEASKTIEVREFQDATTTEDPRYFLIPEANALVFTKKEKFGGEIRPNYFNSRSYIDKAVGMAYRMEQPFFEDHEIPTRFKSSYPYHIVTIKRCDGTKKDVPVIMVQENLGSKEKIDCKLFNAPGGSIGVYFDGGNEYTPDTTTVIGASDFDGYTPEWNEIGQLVFIGGLSGKYITGSGYDESRGYYFTVDGTTTDDIESTVQVTYNKQVYNVFDFFVFMAHIPKSAIVEIQYGYDFDNIAGTYVSETITRVADNMDWILIRWGSEKNLGDMIFQSFPMPFILLKGKLDTLYPSISETSVGDDKEYSLDQETRLGFSLRFGKLTRKMVTKLSIASGTQFFEANGIILTRNAVPTVDNYGQTNLKTWYCEFGYGGNLLGVQDDELVLDVSTGVVGGGSTAKTGAPIPELGDPIEFDGKTRYVDGSGRFFVIDGGLVATG